MKGAVPPLALKVTLPFPPKQAILFGVTVNKGVPSTVTMAVVWQPFAEEKVIVAVPALIPVTNPFALTVATATLELVQGIAAGATGFANWVVVPEHIVRFPVIGCIGLTVTVAVAVAPGQPTVVYVTV